MKLTENFSLWEFENSDTATRLCIDNTIPEDLKPNVLNLAMELEVLRSGLCQKYNRQVAITILSGYRCPKLNAAVGGSRTSDHKQAQAVDIRASGITPEELFQFILWESGLSFQQCIQEFDRWIHLSISPFGEMKCQALRATKDEYGRTQYTEVTL